MDAPTEAEVNALVAHGKACYFPKAIFDELRMSAILRMKASGKSDNQIVEAILQSDERSDF